MPDSFEGSRGNEVVELGSSVILTVAADSFRTRALVHFRSVQLPTPMVRELEEVFI